MKQLATVTEKLLREHKKGIVERQFQQKRLADAVADIYAQIALLSRVSPIFEDQGVEPSGQERYIADTFCNRAARARAQSHFDQIESNDDERMIAIAKLAYKRGSYGYALFEDVYAEMGQGERPGGDGDPPRDRFRRPDKIAPWSASRSKSDLVIGVQPRSAPRRSRIAL